MMQIDAGERPATDRSAGGRDMNETQTRGGPNRRLLLAIPAVVIIAKVAMHRRAMMGSGWSGPGGGGYGNHRFTGAHDEMGPRAFRLPPRIEAALEAWHTRAHEATDATERESDPPDATA
jgi:hypothetical protein